MLFERYMYSDNCHFKYAKGKPSVSGREFHNYHEVVLFMGGESQLITKNVQIKLTEGSLVLIPREHFHQFFVTDPNNYLRCIVGFSPKGELGTLAEQVMEEVKVLPSPPTHVLSLIDQLMRATEQSFDETLEAMLLDSAVLQILFELKMSAKGLIDRSTMVSGVTLRALEYIDDHYGEDIGLDSVARVLNVSVSMLSHKFKSELNISVYRYITEKRLSMVRQLVERGESLGRAAQACGFKDYSGFFRLYKNQYGACPSGSKTLGVEDRRKK